MPAVLGTISTKLLAILLPLIAPLGVSISGQQFKDTNSLCVGNFPLFQKYMRLGDFGVS